MAKIPHLSPKQFRDACKGKKFLPPTVVVKSYSAEVKADPLDQARSLQFKISTDAVDRDGDTVSVKGWNLDSFKESGVVLWAHDSNLPPIAKPLKTWTEDGALKSIAQFTPEDMNHPLGEGFGYTVYRMFLEGYLKGVSVGFMPQEWKMNEERGGDRPVDFSRQTLLEFSAVPIPSNPEALLDVASKGIDITPIGRWCEMALDNEGTRLILDEKTVEQVRKMTTGSPVQVQAPGEPQPAPEPEQEQEPMEVVKDPDLEKWDPANLTFKAPEPELAQAELYATTEDGEAWRYETEPATPPAKMTSKDWDKLIGTKEKAADKLIDEIGDRLDVLETLNLSEGNRLCLGDLSETMKNIGAVTIEKAQEEKEIENLLGDIDAKELRREIEKEIHRQFIQPITGKLY